MKIKSYSYHRGIKNLSPKITSLAEFNELTLAEPDRVFIPIKQIKGASPSVVVTKGERVKKGTRVAVSGDKVILSSVSGVVEDVILASSVYGGQTEVVVIKNNHKEEQELFKKFNLNSDDNNMLMLPLKRFSIVDYDGVELASKIEALNPEAEKTLIINMISDEPYQLNTPFLIARKSEEITKGALLLATMIQASKIVVVIKRGDDKLYQDFLTSLEHTCSSLDFSVAIFPDVYPLGDEITLSGVISKKQMETVADVREAGILVVDCFSLYALKKLVLDGEVVVEKPLTLITVHEEEVSSKIVWVRVGSTIRDVLNAIDETELNGTKKLVAGGLMRGIALADENASITFNLKSLVVVKNSAHDAKRELQCITCGRCSKLCPVGIVPYEIDEHAINGDYNEAVKCGAEKCNRCGVCSYVCPSKRYLTQRIYYVKEIINNKGLRNE